VTGLQFPEEKHETARRLCGARLHQGVGRTVVRPILGDLGAHVIKLEPTGHGDDTRLWPPFRGNDGTVFLSTNRNKRSIAVDLKTR
jgi:hypothetical protein